MRDEDWKNLILARLESADEALNDARILHDSGSYRGANNRSYYAIFNALNAIHAMDGVGFRRHKDVIAEFNKKYVKTGEFPKECGRKINEAARIRNASDYDTFYVAEEAVSLSQIDFADDLINTVRHYIEQRVDLYSRESEEPDR